MKITDILKKEKKTFSFEFFPPKDEISAVDFGINVGQLMKLDPSFVSVTYGAGGSTQERTFALVDFLNNKIGLTTMAHYTCVNATREKVEKDMETLSNMGIKNTMLLRGDPPKGSETFEPIKNGFSYASELISFVRSKFDFGIGGGVYPELHPESENPQSEIHHLIEKVNAGTDFLISQMFFDNSYYFNFVNEIRAAGITIPVLPGLIPITNVNQIKRFAQLSNAHIPQSLIDKLDPVKDHPEKVYKIGVDYAISQACELLGKGAPGIHFYTLNKSRAAVEIFEAIQHLR